MPSVYVNGELCEAPDLNRLLLSYIRFDLGLTGTKYGCGEGECGNCTILVDGEPVNSCLVNVETAEGKQIRTIEGLARGRELHPVQEAFIEASAMQCGFCIPGFIMTTVALLEHNPQPDREQIRAALAKNICRCGTYPRIEQAIERAVQLAGAAK